MLPGQKNATIVNIYRSPDDDERVSKGDLSHSSAAAAAFAYEHGRPRTRRCCP